MHPAPSPRPCQNLPTAAVAMLPADTNTKVTTWQLALRDITNCILQIKQKEMALLSSNKLKYQISKPEHFNQAMVVLVSKLNTLPATCSLC